MVLKILLAGILLPASQAFAATQLGSTEDAHIQSTLSTPPYAVIDGTGSQLYAGCAGSVGKDRCSVVPVQLPNLGAVANPFTNVSFLFNYEAKNGTVKGNVDVHGLGRRTAPTVLADDYWTATSAVDTTDATLIAQDVITENSTAYGTKTVSNSALLAYLNAQYANGAGAGKYVFLRLSVDAAQTGAANRYLITSADGGTAATVPRIVYNETTPPVGTSERPFIWVRNSEKAGILSKIASYSWAQSAYNKLVSRPASDVSAHQSNRDSYLRGMSINWTASPPVFKTGSTLNNATEGFFNTALECAVLYYLTGDEKYARCAADILYNSIQAYQNLTPSTSVQNGGWLDFDDLLYEARQLGTQLPVVYDFLQAWLLNNEVYDVSTGGMTNFNFPNAQFVFRKYYELVRDHGGAGSNWSALMGTCMLNSLLALDDKTERASKLQVYLTTGSSRQASLDYDYQYYKQRGDIWPESLQYASGVGEIRTAHMVLLERYDPSLKLFDKYPNLPLSLPRIRELRYPNNTEQISFGDGHRGREGQPTLQYEMVYRHAKERGYNELATYVGQVLNGAIADGEYNRSNLPSVSSLGQHNETLHLLWSAPVVTEPSVTLKLPRTDRLPYAGIALQRNESPNGDKNYGLMGFVGGAGFVHSHASGMSMELYGMGQVMGAKGGRTTYGQTINENYYRVFAGNNTIIVNGASRGEGGWKGLSINTVDTVSMEPQAFKSAVSPNLSFSTSSFNDDKGTLAEATQQRTLALVRTSDTTGFYVDLFRSKSTVTSRTATTLNGNVKDQYHDYIYRNIGDLAVTIKADGANLPLFSQATRFQNDIGDAVDQPGWRYFKNTQVSYPQQSNLFAQFKATPSGKSSIYMDMHMPSIAAREVAKVDSPAIVEAPAPYDSKDSPTLAIRQIGEAWDKPFVSVFEPHFNATGGTVVSTTALRRGNTVVGVRVESKVGGKSVVHHVISNPSDNQTYEDFAGGLTFQGRFAIVADFGGGDFELYIGDGRSLAYKGTSITSLGGDTEASLVSRPGRQPVVTSNGAVNVAVAAAKPGPVAHWPLNEGSGTTTADVSGSYGAATLLNGAAWGSDATRGTFVNLDGTNDRISTAFTYALKDADDFTWAWWAKGALPATDTTQRGSIMVGNRYPERTSPKFGFIKMTPSGAQFANTDDATAGIGKYNYAVLPQGAWHHYAMVKKGTSYQWYVDGAAQGAAVTISYNETSPVPFLIGGDDDGSGTRVNEHFKGGIDDVVLYREALSPDAVANVMNGIYLPEVTMVALGSPRDLTDGAAWSDGKPAHSGASYIVPNTGNLRSETGTSTFPGLSLTVEAGGRFQARGIEEQAGKTTVGSLILSGGSSFGAGGFAELTAGTGTSVTNLLEGKITNSGFSRFQSYGSAIARSLKVRSLIAGNGRIQAFEGSGDGLSAVIIDNPANTFFGTWEAGPGSSLVFTSAAAAGTGDIEVQPGGRLEIRGHWTARAALSVADTPGTKVNLGSYGWTVSTLAFGGVTTPDGVYAAAALNGLGANPVFIGAGTIIVGGGFPDGPLAHWSLDERSGTVAVDQSGGGRNGTLLNGAAWGSDGTRGSFVTFDGVNDRISTPFTYALSAGSDFTWAWWAKPTTTGSDAAVMVGNRFPEGAPGEQFEFIKFTPAEAQFANTDSAGSIEKFAYANLPVGGWHHYAMVKTGTSYQWYVDGVAQGAALEIAYNESSPIPFFIGGDGDNKPNEHFTGNIDDVALYGRALSTVEITHLKNGIHGNFPRTSALEDWLLRHFGTLDESVLASDSNRDGESDLFEFATGQDPHAATQEAPTLSVNGSDLEFRYYRNYAAETDGVEFKVEWSDAPQGGPWSDEGVVDAPDTDNPDPDGTDSADGEYWKATVPKGASGRRFMHLKVSRPDP